MVLPFLARMPLPSSRWVCLRAVSKRVLWRTSVVQFSSEGHKTWQDWESLRSKANIILMGSPGCGKTTTGRIVAQRSGRTAVDVDDHYLEPYWGTTVADKLKAVGDAAFVEEEGQALLNLSPPQHSVISLTGSNPLHSPSMQRLAQSGLVVFLDVSTAAILRRLHAMKVDRIVGQHTGAQLAQILEYRQSFYEQWYDVRVIVEDGESPDSIADKVLEAVDQFSADRGFVSTRGGGGGGGGMDEDPPGLHTSFLDTVLQGLVPDGGLFVKPQKHIPRFTLGQLKRLVDLDFRERSLRLLERWIHPLDLRPQEIRRYLYRSYRGSLFGSVPVVPVRHLVQRHYLLELFHGPTASFKDLALQLMPQFFTRAVAASGDSSKYLILVATSGDTGGAVLDGFSRHAEGSGIGVLVLYPRHGISKIQHHQMASMTGSNIKVIGVDADFDYCQTLIKRVFSDVPFTAWMKDNINCKLSAANSINFGRLLPQVLYHVLGYLEMARLAHINLGDPIDCCVPTGNFGNILSAYYAKEMGIPVRRLICASNANHALTDFLTKGVYVLSGRSVQRTASPSIDILQSSNVERLIFHLCEEDSGTVRQFYETLRRDGVAAVPENVWESIQEQFLAAYATEDECEDIAMSTFRETGYLMDPHTAVGRAVACHVGQPYLPTLISGTAHFAKFLDKILPFFRGDVPIDADALSVSQMMERAESLARLPSMHQGLRAMVEKPVVHRQHLPPDYGEITKAVAEFAATL